MIKPKNNIDWNLFTRVYCEAYIKQKPTSYVAEQLHMPRVRVTDLAVKLRKMGVNLPKLISSNKGEKQIGGIKKIKTEDLTQFAQTVKQLWLQGKSREDIVQVSGLSLNQVKHRMDILRHELGNPPYLDFSIKVIDRRI